MFLAAQTLLGCCALVSKLLWTAESKASAKARSLELRTTLGMTEESALRSRAVRNHIVHFDERLDRATGRGIVIDRIVGPEASAVVVEGMDTQEYLRRIDPETMTHSVLGDSVVLPNLLAELLRVGALDQRIYDEPIVV